MGFAPCTGGTAKSRAVGMVCSELHPTSPGALTAQNLPAAQSSRCGSRRKQLHAPPEPHKSCRAWLGGDHEPRAGGAEHSAQLCPLRSDRGLGEFGPSSQALTRSQFGVTSLAHRKGLLKPSSALTSSQEGQAKNAPITDGGRKREMNPVSLHLP